MKDYILKAFIAFLFIITASQALSDEFKFCFTEWPPYSIKSKDLGGYAGAIINEALTSNNHTYAYKFYP